MRGEWKGRAREEDWFEGWMERGKKEQAACIAEHLVLQSEEGNRKRQGCSSLPGWLVQDRQRGTAQRAV